MQINFSFTSSTLSLAKGWTLAIGFVAVMFCQLEAQSNNGLVAYYSFDDCTAKDQTGNGPSGIVAGSPQCVCGVRGTAFEFDGVDDYVTFSGIVNQTFLNDNFTISFYFKPYDAAGLQTLLSKREACSNNAPTFDVEYAINLNTVNTDLSESNTTKSISVNNLDPTCWHHYAMVRKGSRMFVYLNGKQVDERISAAPLNLSNNGTLALANSPCVGSNTQRFRGKIDELRLYVRVLTPDEIGLLYYRPDMIYNRDTVVFLGGEMQANTTSTCAVSFNWQPVDGVSDPTIPNPVILPAVTTTYELAFLDAEGCTTTDTVRIKVIDPSALDCNQIFLPKAFTPNNGDNLNPVFAINNPQSVERLLSFTIYDRWGGRIFETADPFAAWDGTYKNTPVAPGVYLYTIRYLCKNTEQVLNGTVAVVR